MKTVYIVRLKGKKTKVELCNIGLCEYVIYLGKPVLVCKFLAGDDGLYEIYAEPENTKNSESYMYKYRITIKSITHGYFHEVEVGKGIFKENSLIMEDQSKLQIDTDLNLWKPFDRDYFRIEAKKFKVPEEIINIIS